MKKALVIIICLWVTHMHSQLDFSAHKNSIFLVCRGTKLKRNIVSRDFNLSDQNSTHIGIGFVENNVLKIYNVSTDEEVANKYFYVENYESFTNLSGIFHASLWEHKTTQDEIKKLKKILDGYSKMAINFDMKFELNNGNSLYCSEFVYLVLKSLNPKKYKYSPTTKKLNLFYSSVLKKETMVYIPVDFFQKGGLFKNVFEKAYQDIK